MDEISLQQVWRTLARYRRLIIATTSAGVIAAAAIAWLTTPVYRVDVLLAPVGDEPTGALSGVASQFGGLAALAGVDLRGNSSSKDEAIALLRSRSVTGQLIEANDLLPILYADEWDASSAAWKSSDPEEVPTLWDAFRLFDDEIRHVTENPKAGLVTLAIDWTDPVLAKSWADELVQRVNRETRDRAIREAERSLAYLNQQLQKTDIVELRQAIFSLIETQTKQMMLASVREDYAFKVIDPAVVPDLDDPIRPRPVLLIALGATTGLLLGVLLALLLGAGSGFEAPVRRPQ